MTDLSMYLEDAIFYYSRAKMYRTMQIIAVEGIKMFSQNPIYKLYYCISLMHEGRSGESEEVLNEIKDFSDVSLASLILLTHLEQPQQSFESILKGRAKDLLEIAGEMALYLTGVCFVLLNKPDKARHFIVKVIKVPAIQKKASVLLGWIEMLTNDGSPSKEVWKYFECADNSSPEAVFGRAKYFERQKNYIKALEYLNQAIVLFPKYPPAFVEKMKIHLTLEDWEQTIAAAQRALLLDGSNIEAMTFSLVHMLTQENKIDEVEEKLKNLYLTIMKNEPKNADLLCETAKLISRLSGLHKPILEATFSMAKKAAELKPSDAETNAELGYQYLYLGKASKAAAIFKAHACDRSVTGSLQCLILQEEYERAYEQIQVYKECETEFSHEMFYIVALLTDKMVGSSELIIQYLTNAFKLHLQNLKDIPWSMTYYSLLQPILIKNMSKLVILHIPDQLSKSKILFAEILKLCKSAVNCVHMACPGFLGFSFSVILANVKMLEGDLPSAKAILYQCVDKEDSNPEGRILLAQLHLKAGNLYAASHCLEVALSFNFEVRENFDYLLIKAEIQRQQGLLTDAAETLNFAKSIAFPNNAKDPSLNEKVPLSKKIHLYVLLIKVHCDLNMQEEANAAIREANTLFRDTPEFDRLRFAVAYFALSRNDVSCALKILEEIKPDKSCYFEALQQRAEIYLNHKKDRIKFINCYREAVKEKNTPETLNLLGEAFMKIQEPEKAVEAYEQALKLNPKDSDLASKIGTALVKTHNYEKAVTYYKAAIKSGGSECLRYDLCALLCVIKRYKESEELIKSVLDTVRDREEDNLNWLAMESKYLCLLSEVYSKMEMQDQAMSTLQKAWSVQTRVLRKVHMEQTDIEMHRKKAKEICCQLANFSSQRKDYGSAVQFYREALTFDEGDTEILLALARLQIESHDIDAARQYCATVLSKDNENIPAAVMLADMMFEAGDLQSAKFQFQKLLNIKPDFFEAIARYIEVVRRLGKLESAESCLKKAESVSGNLAIDPGFYYCKGLYEWYTGNTSYALKCFNKTRSISLWGQISLCHMIEICLNPENENFSGENVDVDGDILKDKSANSQEGNIRTAEKLLLELKSKYGVSLNTRIFDNLIRLAKRTKQDAEAALNDFIEILTDERYKEHAGAILGSAMAYLRLKQTPRARNQLKRIAKTTWNFSDAEYLEKAWLLLADVYIKAGKYPSASEMLDKVLIYNKSCTKAYDLYGYIAEKEQNYRDAVKHFEKAWFLTSKLNPVIGYKLAFNNMKAKRYAEAIDVCQVVLNKCPNYPKIRKEILDRSRTHLRT